MLNRDALLKHLHDKGIGAGVHYPVAIPLQKAYCELGHRPGDFPNAEAACREELSCLFTRRSPGEQIEEVCAAVIEFKTPG